MHKVGKVLVNINKAFWIFVNVFQIIGKKGERVEEYPNREIKLMDVVYERYEDE